MPELIFIMLIALLIFGPAQLPKIGKQLGKALGDFKRASNEFKNQLEDEVHQLELQQMVAETKQAFSLEPPAGTVAKEPEQSIVEQTILPPSSQPPQGNNGAGSAAAPVKPAGDQLG